MEQDRLRQAKMGLRLLSGSRGNSFAALLMRLGEGRGHEVGRVLMLTHLRAVKFVLAQVPTLGAGPNNACIQQAMRGSGSKDETVVGTYGCDFFVSQLLLRSAHVRGGGMNRGGGGFLSRLRRQRLESSRTTTSSHIFKPEKRRTLFQSKTYRPIPGGATTLLPRHRIRYL